MSMPWSRFALGLLLAVVLATPLLVWAQPQDGDSAQGSLQAFTIKLQVPIPGFPQTQAVNENLFGNYLVAFFQFFMGAVVTLATAMIVFGGIRWVTAGGSASKVQSGKEMISSAIIGLVLALTSVVILRTINPRLVQFRALTPTSIIGVSQGNNAFCDRLNNRTIPAPGVGEVCGHKVTYGNGQECISAVCATGRICTYVTGTTTAAYQCLDATQACLRANENRCAEVDRQIQQADLRDATGRPVACRKQNNAAAGDNCYIGTILQCPSGTKTTLSCDMGNGRDTPCWSDGQPRGDTTIHLVRRACTSNSRAATGYDSICCGGTVRSEAFCLPTPPSENPNNEYVEVDCNTFFVNDVNPSLNSFRGPGDSRLTSCPATSHCYTRIRLVN